MADCRIFSDRRIKCHSVYGKQGEDCLHEELTEKRCLSLHHCPRQAKEYYGDAAMTTDTLVVSNDGGSSLPFLVNKAICASWAESFAYVDRELEFGLEVVDHHRDAKEIVSKDRALKRECRDVAFALAKCLQHKKLF